MALLPLRAYKELKRDGCFIFFSFKNDIADVLTSGGFNTGQLVSDMLHNDFFRTGVNQCLTPTK